jgi:hypothetical protein
MSSPSDTAYLSAQSPVRSDGHRLRLKTIGPTLALMTGVGFWALFAYALWRLLS